MKSIEELREDLETLCILRGDFTLASGKKSNYYYNGKAAMLSGKVKIHLARALLKLAEGIDFDVVGGPAVGAVPLVEHMSIVSALEKDHTFDTFYVRSETKQHGTASSLYQAKKFNGNDTLIKNTKALIVEDTLTTGGSIQVALKAVEEIGAEVAGVLIVADRQDSDADWIRNQYDYRALFNVSNSGHLINPSAN
ncbi:MAG: orotate phosphoribosyltransferase [Chloroflexi bacterium]|jgi:orotate phosphoribosyltransferase|nr:orotate phosphoribosyltransferase [Chloroflexota bacterium]MCH2524127.1 orotate phosphoribosyltransferase [Dehalococcoidia bacterium]|tara:strand:+ start:11448 stop:12032 length:585 start_codon:yes stop_codon:yes gene_type:complete